MKVGKATIVSIILVIYVPILCLYIPQLAVVVVNATAAFSWRGGCSFHRHGRHHRRSTNYPAIALQFRKQQSQDVRSIFCRDKSRCASTTRLLMSGYGIATNYTWKEEAYEIDVSVWVPKSTRTKDILFKATSRSIDLRLLNAVTATATTTNSDIVTDGMGAQREEIALLDGKRTLRGRINTDGTYWVISDSPSARGNHTTERRQITVTIEKIIATPKDDFEIVDYDWKGVYHMEDTDEVVERKYDQPEPLDIRQYASEMGVDIDNLNMSMVDKNMFNSGLNISKSTLNSLHQAGYLSTQEITQQADGTEYIVNEDGEPERINNTPDMPTATRTTSETKERSTIPFVDTESPWHKVSATNNNETVLTSSSDEKIVQLKRNFTRAAFAEDSVKMVATSAETNPFVKKKTSDPIDALTVSRLKEILKAEGLKTGGTKSELQDRLRNKVNALLQGKDQQ
jgi:SAP domain/CS domain